MITFQLQLPYAPPPPPPPRVVPPVPQPAHEWRESLLSRLYEWMVSNFLLKFKMADGESVHGECRATNLKCDKNCCLHSECIYSFFFNAKLSRNISSFMLFFGTQLQFSLRKCVQSDTVLPSLASCLKAKDKNICMFSDVVGRCTLSRVWVGKYSKSTDCNSLPCDFFQGSRSTWFSFCPVNEELVKVRFTTQIEWSLHSKG